MKSFENRNVGCIILDERVRLACENVPQNPRLWCVFTVMCVCVMDSKHMNYSRVTTSIQQQQQRQAVAVNNIIERMRGISTLHRILKRNSIPSVPLFWLPTIQLSFNFDASSQERLVCELFRFQALTVTKHIYIQNANTYRERHTHTTLYIRFGCWFVPIHILCTFGLLNELNVTQMSKQRIKAAIHSSSNGLCIYLYICIKWELLRRNLTRQHFQINDLPKPMASGAGGVWKYIQIVIVNSEMNLYIQKKNWHLKRIQI